MNRNLEEEEEMPTLGWDVLGHLYTYVIIYIDADVCVYIVKRTFSTCKAAIAGYSGLV